MANKNTKTKPSPFHKGKEKDPSEYGIPDIETDMDTAMDEFRTLKEGAGENLWAGARNLMNIGDNFGGVRTRFDNQYANVTNQYANLQNRFEGMENTFEDLTVNQQQAQFERQMAAQQQADTLSGLRGAAGASGVAGLAQAMSGAQSRQRLQASATLGQQESQLNMAAAQQGARIQEASRRGAAEVDLARAGGAERAEMARARGAAAADQLSSQAELARAGGIQAAQIARGQGAMEAQKIRLQGAADARELALQASQAELSYYAGLKEAAEANKDADQAGKSDRRLKKNITKIGQSPSGLNIYSFEYKNPTDGEGLFQGVMSDEVPQEAVINNGEYDIVNYGLLDVEFKQI